MFDSSTCFGPTGPSSGVVEQPPNVWTHRATHNFTYETNNTQFIDAPEDGPVGPKHVELSNIL